MADEVADNFLPVQEVMILNGMRTVSYNQVDSHLIFRYFLSDIIAEPIRWKMITSDHLYIQSRLKYQSLILQVYTSHVCFTI